MNNEKLPDLLELKYKAIEDAKSSLGEISDIRNLFLEVQKLLYKKVVA